MTDQARAEAERMAVELVGYAVSALDHQRPDHLRDRIIEVLLYTRQEAMEENQEALKSAKLFVETQTPPSGATLEQTNAWLAHRAVVFQRLAAALRQQEKGDVEEK